MAEHQCQEVAHCGLGHQVRNGRLRAVSDVQGATGARLVSAGTDCLAQLAGDGGPRAWLVSRPPPSSLRTCLVRKADIRRPRARDVRRLRNLSRSVMLVRREMNSRSDTDEFGRPTQLHSRGRRRPRWDSGRARCRSRRRDEFRSRRLDRGCFGRCLAVVIRRRAFRRSPVSGACGTSGRCRACTECALAPGPHEDQRCRRYCVRS